MIAGLAGLALLIATGVIILLLRRGSRLPLATPNPRSLHTAPVPRVGGISIWAGALPAILVATSIAPLETLAWAPAWLILVLVSLRDDMRSVSIAARLATHALAALWFACWALASSPMILWPQMLLVTLVALVVAWSLNLYNFMDGSDGLAALMTIVGFAAYVAAGPASAATELVAVAVVAATLPLLVVNLPPARIFMGDAGAVPLGFLAAAFGIAGVVTGRWDIWFPVLVFLPFIADATLTLLRRAWRGERWWEGHRSHYYQRLHLLGAGHGGTLAIYGVLMAGTSITAVICVRDLPEWGAAALAAWTLLLLLPFGAIDYHWRRKTPAP
ncbi:MAG: glycosyl transferase [Casimicrobiaceae bacterium]